MIMKDSRTQYEYDAVTLFRASNTATLSTLSKSTNGYPFGSFVTFSSNSNRDFLIYASDIAEHTKNVINDARSCVTLCSVNHAADKQTSARLSLIGDLIRVPDIELPTCQARFFKFLPDSKKYSRIHGFKFYKLKIIKARWIGGFGDIGWLDTTHWTAEIPKWHKNEISMIEHMNQDHSNVICSALNGKFDVVDPSAQMLALSTDGYYILSADQQYFIQFDEPCYSENSVRNALIKQAKLYRAFELS